jgi:hypothetical protein
VAAVLSVGLVLAVAMLVAPPASAAPTPVGSCQTLDSPGLYALKADLAAVDSTCIEITASDVTLDLTGHTMTCTGSGFASSCQVAAGFRPRRYGPPEAAAIPALWDLSQRGYRSP